MGFLVEMLAWSKGAGGSRWRRWRSVLLVPRVRSTVRNYTFEASADQL
ncbi:hypothetical protein [Streptomyces sp. NPDC058475]